VTRPVSKNRELWQPDVAARSHMAVQVVFKDGAGAARQCQGRLECPCGEFDAIRRQLRNTVRDDRVREVERLASAAGERSSATKVKTTRRRPRRRPSYVGIV